MKPLRSKSVWNYLLCLLYSHCSSPAFTSPVPQILRGPPTQVHKVHDSSFTAWSEGAREQGEARPLHDQYVALCVYVCVLGWRGDLKGQYSFSTFCCREWRIKKSFHDTVPFRKGSESPFFYVSEARLQWIYRKRHLHTMGTVQGRHFLYPSSILLAQGGHCI